MILGLFPEVLGVGGVQRISRHIAAVLASYARVRNLSCHLLSLNDPPGQHYVQVGNTDFLIQGFARRKVRFILAVLMAAPKARWVYIGHPNLAPLGVLVRLIRPDARYWVTTHGIEVWNHLPWYRRLALRFAFAVTAPSRFTAEKVVVEQNVSPGKVTVLPFALDPGFFELGKAVKRSKPSLPLGKKLLTVARLSVFDQYKGVDIVIRALPAVLQVVPNTYYVIVGDGDDRPRLERLVRNIGVSDRVIFTGFVFGSELTGYYDACHVFVMPSRGEGFGVVFLEAMAFGKPVIGGNYGGTPDIILDGVTGYLVKYGDVATLAERLIRLLQDDDLCRRMGEAGQQRVLKYYTFEHFQERLYQLLTEGGVCGS